VYSHMQPSPLPTSLISNPQRPALRGGHVAGKLEQPPYISLAQLYKPVSHMYTLQVLLIRVPQRRFDVVLAPVRRLAQRLHQRHEVLGRVRLEAERLARDRVHEAQRERVQRRPVELGAQRLDALRGEAVRVSQEAVSVSQEAVRVSQEAVRVSQEAVSVTRGSD
jgi:hypothetical protein